MGTQKERKKTVLILGIDGYIGWPLALHLKDLGHTVFGVDNCFRRRKIDSLIPIDDITERRFKIPIFLFDLRSDTLPELHNVDIIIHLAEQPSASWSMKDYKGAVTTQRENVLGTMHLLWQMREKCPNAHLIKLGSMGEYGTPDCTIPEGFIESGPMEGLMFPRTPNSFYHLSKVFDSMNIDFACRTWGLRSTDIMQGIVFGHIDGTRFDYDEHFGTVINRFCTQAVAGIPLTVYGRGGQTRGFLPIEDSIECITLILENSPTKGEYRVFNQFAKVRSVNEIAIMVSHEARKLGLSGEITKIQNPRTEKEHHEYMPRCDHLRELGYSPTWQLDEKIAKLLKTIIPYKDKINKDVIMPTTKWAA